MGLQSYFFFIFRCVFPGAFNYDWVPADHRTKASDPKSKYALVISPNVSGAHDKGYKGEDKLSFAQREQRKKDFRATLVQMVKDHHT